MGQGESEWRSVIMKFLLVLSLVAATQAEADPAFAYGFGGHFLPYAVHHAPLVHAPVVYTHHTGCTNNAGALVPCALGGAVLGLAPVAAAAPAEEAAAPVEAVDRKKREAEAEPEAEADAEADPWLYYSTHGYWPVGYSHYAHYAPLAYSGHHYGYYGLKFFCKFRKSFVHLIMTYSCI